MKAPSFCQKKTEMQTPKLLCGGEILAAMKWLPKFYFFQRARVTVRVSVV
jgi:hypothetical protein